MAAELMAQTVSMKEINTNSEDASDHSSSDEERCYAIFKFPDSLYLIRTSKLVLGREPDDVNSYDQRLLVTEEGTNNPRKRKRTRSGSRSGSVSTLFDEDIMAGPLLSEAPAYEHMNYENCVTSIGGIGGPQPEPMLSDDPEEVFLAIHPSVNEHGEVQDQAISKKHIRIQFDSELGWTVEVLGRNGIFLNQTWHGKGDELLLQDKDEFTVAGLTFSWHITDPQSSAEDESFDSDDDVLSDYDENPEVVFEDVKSHVIKLPSRSAQAMDLEEDDEEEEEEEDDGYREDYEEEKPRPKVVPKQKKQSKAERRREQKARSKAKKKQRALDEKKERELAKQAALEDESEESEVEEVAEAKPSLKLKLKIPKKAGKSIKELAAKKMPAKAPKLVKDETMEVIEYVRPSGKKPMDLAGKAPNAMDVPHATTEAGELMTDVVQSAEKSERQLFTPTGGLHESAQPNDSATPQVGNRRDPVLAGLEPPPKRRGPGRPPADGVMSKRERRERQKAEAAGIPYGDPLPWKERSAGGDLGGSGEKPKKKVKREVTGDEEGGGDDGDDKGEPSPPRPREPSPKESDYPPERLQKPDETYQVLLYQVLQEAKEPLALPGVYDAIKNKWPYYRFKVGGTGWESSVRHNLQSSRYFMKAGKAGKGHLWALDPNEPFEHKTKRASPPPGSAPYQQPRPSFGYQNGQPGARPAVYNQYYQPQNGQRPPGQQPYYNPNMPGQNRPPPGQQRPANGYPPGTLLKTNPALTEVLQGTEPEVFGKFIEQLRKITQTPGAPDGPNAAVDQAKAAIVWIMTNKQSDAGIETQSPQLQHMVKVLRTLLEPVPVNPIPPRPAGAPMNGPPGTAPPTNAPTLNGAPPGQPGLMTSGVPGQNMPPNGVAGQQIPRNMAGPPPAQGSAPSTVANNPSLFPGQVPQTGAPPPALQQVPNQAANTPVPGQISLAPPPQVFQPGPPPAVAPNQAAPMANGSTPSGTAMAPQGPTTGAHVAAASTPGSISKLPHSAPITAPSAAVSGQAQPPASVMAPPAAALGPSGSGSTTNANAMPTSVPAAPAQVTSGAAPTSISSNAPSTANVASAGSPSSAMQNDTPNATATTPAPQGAQPLEAVTAPSLPAGQGQVSTTAPSTSSGPQSEAMQR